MRKKYFILFILSIIISISFFLELDTSGQRSPASQNSQWANLESSQICYFQGRSFGQMNQEEFLNFKAQKLSCKEAIGETVVIDKFIIPYWIPLIPIDLIKKSVKNLAFLFQINANLGRHYVHMYLENGDVNLNSHSGNPLPDNLPEELESIHHELSQLEEHKEKLELKEKRESLLEQVHHWKKTTDFPYVWDNAVKMGKDEIWSVEGERSFLFGPLLTASFILAERVSLWANYGGSLLSLDFMHRNNYRVTVRKTQGKNGDNIQVLFQTIGEKGIGGGLFSKSLSTDITFAAIIRDSSINLLSGAAMQMNKLDLLPLSSEIFRKKLSKASFIVEFDSTNPEAKRLYNKIMDGDFREIDHASADFKNEAVKITIKNTSVRSSRLTRQTFYLPFLYKFKKTCEQDQFNERFSNIFKNSLNDKEVSLNLVTDICHHSFSGFLKSAIFGESSTTNGVGLANVDYDYSSELALIGTHTYSTEKISQNKLSFYEQYFNSLPIKEIKQDFDEKLNSLGDIKDIKRFDLNFTYLLGKELLLEIIGSDREIQRKVIEESFNTTLPSNFKRYNRTKSGFKRSPERQIAAWDLYNNLGKYDLLKLNLLSDSAFMEEISELKELFQKNKFFLEYTKVFFDLLEASRNGIYQDELGQDIGYKITLVPPENGNHRYHQNPINILDDDFTKISSLAKSNFSDLWKNENSKKKYWFPITSLTGNEGKLSPKEIDSILNGETKKNLVKYECECQFANENEEEFHSAIISGIAISEDNEETLPVRTYGRALNQCVRASNEISYTNKNLDKNEDIHYIRVPLNSCKVMGIELDSYELAQNMLQSYEKLNSQIEEILSRETTCDKAMIFKHIPNGFRKAFSTVLGGYGWRIRGGGFEEELEKIPLLDGNMATVSISSLISYISANSCKDFIAGVKASMYLAVGGVPGWGECFDMGNDGINWRGEKKEKYFHDLPCMTTRMNFTTSMMASYLESQGYEFNQDMSGPTISMIYLLSKNYEPEVWREVVVESPKYFKPLAINTRISLSEFITGMIYGYNLSESLLNGQNGEYIKKDD